MPANSLVLDDTTPIWHDTVSPGQGNTRVVLDCATPVANEAAYSQYRKSSDVVVFSGTGLDSVTCQNMRRWKSGAITLQPVQEKLNFAYETLPEDLEPGNFVFSPVQNTGGPLQLLVAAAYTAIETNLWQFPTGNGFIRPPRTSEKGDPFYQRAIKSDGSWANANNLSPQPPQLSNEPGLIPGTLLFPPPSTGIDTVFYNTRNMPADQGFFLRWFAPGISSSTPDFLFNFYFGQYCLILDGSGTATIAEYCQPLGGGAYRWRKRTTFPYCRQGAALGQGHSMTIFPHRGPNGEKYISFSAAEHAPTQGTSTGILTAASNAGLTGNATEYLYEATSLMRFGDIDPAPSSVTKSAPIRFDERRDIRVAYNASLLVFFNVGTLDDAPFSAPDATTLVNGENGPKPRPFQVRVDAQYPPDINGNIGTITPTIRDADTLTDDYIVHPYVNLTFRGKPNAPIKGASFSTPILWGYELFRDANIIIANPGAFTVPVQSLDLSGIAGPDPISENGRVSIDDVAGTNYPKLSNRGEYECAVLMDYQTPGDEDADIFPVVLARGYAVRPEGTKLGTSRRGYGFSPWDQNGQLLPVREYPSPDWHKWDFLFSGMSRRMNNLTPLSIHAEHFDTDPNAPIDPVTKIRPPWKVTDTIRFLLKTRGFLDSMVIVPDLPFRLWPGAETYMQDAVYDLGVDVVMQCSALARNYLGGYIIFDSNAGPLGSTVTGDASDNVPMGAWRLVLPPPVNAAPVYHFFGSPQKEQVDGGLVMPFSPRAFDQPNSTCIMRPLVVKPKAPELNHVWVMTAPFVPGVKFRYETHAYNGKSFSVPGWSVQPDPASPHYLGYQRTYPLIDASLLVPNDASATRRALNLTARRILEYAGVGRKLLAFEAPLAIINDPETGRPRPLRYYDPVTVNGETGWYVRSVSVSFRTRQHTADYELEKKYEL